MSVKHGFENGSKGLDMGSTARRDCGWLLCKEFPIPAYTDSKHPDGRRTLLLTDELTGRVHILLIRVTKSSETKDHPDLEARRQNHT